MKANNNEDEILEDLLKRHSWECILIKFYDSQPPPIDELK